MGERQTDRQADRQTETERQTDRDRERQRERESTVNLTHVSPNRVQNAESKRGTVDRHTKKYKQTVSQRQTETMGLSHPYTDRQTIRDKQTETMGLSQPVTDRQSKTNRDHGSVATCH